MATGPCPNCRQPMTVVRGQPIICEHCGTEFEIVRRDGKARLQQVKKAPAAATPDPKRKFYIALFFLVSIMVVVAGIYIVWNVNIRIGAVEKGRVNARLFVFCIDMMPYMFDYDPLNTEELGDRCREWADSIYNQDTREEGYKLDQALACHRASPEITQFEECLIDEGIVPPGIVSSR